MPTRLPSPGPSFVREHEVRIGEHVLRAGMSRPTEAPDAWWLTVLWVLDDEGVVPFADVAPSAGPPPDPPLARLGPALSGALSGFIREEAGRLAIRLAQVAQPDDPLRPWHSPIAVRAAFGWEPARAATLRPNELADIVLGAFRRSVEGLHGR